MQIARTLGVSLLGASLTGCANAPTSPLSRDIDFVRGCWVEKNAQNQRIDALLRLLPDGSEYAGRLEYVRGIRPGPEIRVSVARDGTSAPRPGMANASTWRLKSPQVRAREMYPVASFFRERRTGDTRVSK